MAQPAEPVHSDPAAGWYARAAHRVERGDPGAAHRCGIEEVQTVRDAGQRTSRYRDRLGPAPGVADPGDLPVRTVHHLTVAAGIAVPAAASEPADGHPVADAPPGDTRTELGDRARDLVPRGDRRRGASAGGHCAPVCAARSEE